MRKPLQTIRKGEPVYIIDAKLVSDGQKTMRVRFMDRTYFFPKAHVEMIEPGKFALKPEFFDILWDQGLFKKTTMAKAVLNRLMSMAKKN